MTHSKIGSSEKLENAEDTGYNKECNRCSNPAHILVSVGNVYK